MHIPDDVPLSTPPSIKPKSERGPWIVAWVVSLLLHAVAFLGFRQLPPSHVPPARADTIMVQLNPGTRSPEESRFFSELPPERADEAPKQPDLLSNVTSRARDRVAGGDAALPRLEGDVDDPVVRLERTKTGAQSSALAHSGAESAPSELPGDASAIREQESTPKTSGALSRQPPASPGSSGIPQPEMAHPGGNAPLTGEVSLNTTAWDYAPWLGRFRDRLMERWYAPPAYYYGILKEGGWALFDVEISKSGKLLRVDLLDKQGHPSLTLAAQNALRSIAPIEPLPADFPEPTLILRIRMIYPEVRPR